MIDPFSEVPVETQASRVIAKFGSPYKLVAAMKAVDGKTRAASSIYRWGYPRSKGGSDGQIPTRALRLVMDAARMEGIFIAAEDLYPGGK